MGGDSVLFARYTGGDSVLVNKKEWGGFCRGGGGGGGDFVRIPGNMDNYNISDEFEFRPDPTSDCGVICP